MRRRWCGAMHWTIISTMRRVALLPLLSACCAVAHAQAPPEPPASPLTDHFGLRASAFLGSVSTDGTVNDTAAGVAGDAFSFENDLHMKPKANQLRAELMFRMRERSRLRVDLWQLDRHAVGPLVRNLRVGSSNYLINDTADSRFNWQQVDFTYTYSFLHGERYELGAGLGIHLLQAEAESTVAARALHESLSGAGPFATIALYGGFRLARRWSLNLRGQYFHLKVNKVKGSLADYHFDLQYRWRPNLAFGLGYLSTSTQLDVSGTNPDGSLKLATHGAELFARASF
jgi:hypothetical protein